MQGQITPLESYSQFCANWRVRLKDRRVHPEVYRYWPQCMAVEKMSRDELLDFQRRRLCALLKHAVLHVPFYREWAKRAGVTDRDVDSLHLSDFPIVTKADFRRDASSFQSEAYRLAEMRPAKASGSSGEPFCFWTHPRLADYGYACLWRGLARHGIRPGDRRVYVWGQAFTFGNTALKIRIRHIRNRVRDWLNNTISINAYSLSERNVDDAIHRIEMFGPVYIHGYVSAIYQIARRLLDTNRNLAQLALKAVVTESEKLYDFQRQAIREAFAAPVVEHYGSVEFGVIAQEDPAGRLRINDDAFVVERHEDGAAVITNLQSAAYPFIRYRLGDLIEIDPTPEGTLPYSSLAKVVGRTVDMIPLPQGGAVHGVALAHVIDPHLSSVLKYQIRQTALTRFQIDLVSRGPLPESVTKQIDADLRKLVGEDVSIEIRQVADIRPASSGKYRWVLSEIDSSGVGPQGQQGCRSVS